MFGRPPPFGGSRPIARAAPRDGAAGRPASPPIRVTAVAAEPAARDEARNLGRTWMSFSVKTLKQPDWESFRSIRLRALQEHPNLYLGTYKDTIARSESEWQAMLDGNGKCIFGLFDKDQLIGLAAVFTSRDDPTGKTAVMAMDYIESHYRGGHLSRMLYQARIEWAKQQPFKRLVISHREGNEVSRRANQAFKFKFIGAEFIEWPDGKKALDYRYELDLEALRGC